MTGIMDNALTNGRHEGLEQRLVSWRDAAVSVNEQWAKKLGINKAAAVTAVNPSGTASPLCDSASGIHARHSEYYLRTVRGANTAPLTRFMHDMCIPAEPCVLKPNHPPFLSSPMSAVCPLTSH